jgi:hypothetical protein
MRLENVITVMIYITMIVITHTERVATANILQITFVGKNHGKRALERLDGKAVLTRIIKYSYTGQEGKG